MAYKIETKSPFKAFVYGLFTGAVLATATAIISDTYHSNDEKIIPNNNNVQPGCIAPSQIERIICKDINGDGILETIETIAGVDYVKRWKAGKPIFVPVDEYLKK